MKSESSLLGMPDLTTFCIDLMLGSPLIALEIGMIYSLFVLICLF